MVARMQSSREEVPFLNFRHARWAIGVLKLVIAVVGDESLVGLIVRQARSELVSVLRDTDEVSIGKRVYAIRYDMPSTANKLVEEEDVTENVMGQSLLEKAGLVKPKDTRRGGGKKKHFDPADLPEED